MPSVSALRSVKIVFLSEGANELRLSMNSITQAQKDLSDQSDRTTRTLDTSSRGALSATDKFGRLYNSLDGGSRALRALERDLGTVNRALAADASLLGQAGEAAKLLQRRYDEAIASTARLSSEQRALARDTIAARDAANAQASAYQTSLNQRLGLRTPSVTSSREDDIRSAFADADRRRAAVDPLFKAQQAYRADLASLRSDLAAGVLREDAYTAALGRRKAAFVEQMATLGRVSAAEREFAAATERSAAAARSAANATEGWRGLSAQGSASLTQVQLARARVDANAEASRRLGSLGGASGSANDNVGRRLRADETTNLMYQGGDIATQLGSGTPLAMIAMQQGPQIAQIFAGPGGASLKETFKQAGEAAGGFVSRIGPAGAAIGVVTLAAGVSVLALASYRSAYIELERTLSGVGRTSGVTAAQVNELANAQARAGGISRATAREAAAAYATTGRVDASNLGDALGTTVGFSRFLNVDQKEGASQLAAALSDVSKGATDLSQRYGLLNDAQAESVRRMDAQGDRLGAQKALLAAVRESTRGLAEETRGWSRIAEAVGNGWDKIGRNVSKVVFGGTLDEELAKAQRRLSSAQTAAEINPLAFNPRDIRAAQEDVNRFQSLVDRRNEAIEQAQRAQRSSEIGSVVRSMRPEQAEFQAMQDRVERLRKAISDPLKFGLDQRQLVDVTLAFERLSRTTKSMAEDIERYGSVSVAALNRQADFDVRVAGMNPVERSSAEIDKKLSDFIRDKSLDPKATASGVQAQYELRMSTTADMFERNRLAQERDQRLQDVRQMEGMRREREQQQEALRIRTEDNAVRSSRVPDNFLQAVIRAESDGNRFAKNPLSSATGAGQFIEKTWLEMFRKEFPQRALNMSREQILAQRNDRETSETLSLSYARENARKLELAQIPVNNTSLYAAHHFGPAGAVAMYRADPNTPARQILGDDAADRNKRTIGNLTVGQSLNAIATSIARNDPGIRSARQQTEQLRAEATVLDLSTAARARNERAQELLNQEHAKGSEVARTYTNVQELLSGSVKNASVEAQAGRQAILEVATAYGRASAEVTNFRGRQELMFERSQLGRSEADASSFARTYSRYRETSSPEAQAFRETARMNEGLRETRLLATDAFSGMLTDLRRGGDLVSSLSNMTGRLADRFLSMAADKTIGALFAGGGGTSSDGGIFGSIAKFFASGFSGGGYTGPGDRLAPAGVVHRGEVVWSQMDVARVGGVAAAEAIRRGLPGYDKGGPVGVPVWMPPPANAPAPAGITGITVNNYGNPDNVRVTESPDGRGGRRVEVTVDEAVANALSRPGSKSRAAAAQPRVATR